MYVSVCSTLEDHDGLPLLRFACFRRLAASTSRGAARTVVYVPPPVCCVLFVSKWAADASGRECGFTRPTHFACCHLPSLPAYSPLALPIGGEKPKSARKKNEWAGYGKQHHARRAQLYLYVLPWGQHRPGHGTCISRAKAARARARARGEGSRAAAAPSEIPMQFAIPQPSLAAHPAPPSSPNRSPPCHQFDSAPDVAREPRRLRASRRCLSAPSPKQPRSIRWGRDAAHAALVAFGRPRPPRPLTRDYARWQPSSRAVTRHSICGRQGLCSVSGVSQASRRLPRVVEHNPGTQSGLARPRAGEEETLLVRAPWHWRRLPQSRSLAHIFLRAFPPPLLTAPPV